MKKIGQYELLNDNPMSTSSAVFYKASKDGRTYFLKKFNDPTFPSERIKINAFAEYSRRAGLCNKFENHRKTVNSMIAALGGGNFVAPTDFFLFENSYYQATAWREIENRTIDDIVRSSDEEKLLILKTASNCLRLLHEKGIIHCDIKPENMPVTLTSSNKSTCSLIDFDSAILESNVPTPEEIFGTDRYWSPELMSYKMRRDYYPDKKVTVKNDVFATAIVFHYYWSGENISYSKPQKGPYLHHAVLEDLPISLSNKIPEWLKVILLKMIDKQPENRPSMAEVLEYLKQITLNPTEKEQASDTREEKTIEQKPEQTNSFVKGAKFPEDAVSFDVLPNGKVKFEYDDGSKMALNIDVALRKQYITEK